VKDTLKELVMLPLQRPELFCKGQLTKVSMFSLFRENVMLYLNIDELQLVGLLVHFFLSIISTTIFYGLIINFLIKETFSLCS
jgi:hypothetical protein